MNQWLSSLGWCVLQVTLLSVAAWVLCVCLRGPKSRNDSLIPGTALVSILALTLLAFLPLPVGWSYGFTWPAAEPHSMSQRSARALPNSPAQPLADQSDQTNRVDESVATNAETTVESTANEAVKATTAPSVVTGPEVPAADTAPIPTVETPGSELWSLLLGNWQVLMVCAAGGSALIGILHLFGGLLATQSYRRLSRPIADPQLAELVDVLRAELNCVAPIELRETSSLTTAATLGWRRPVILLPLEWSGWNHDQQRAVLAHEIAHVVRRDFLTCLLAQASVALHFYHPLVHWLVRRLRLEQELAADALAAVVSGGEQLYLQTLAELALRQAERPLGWPARTFLPTPGTFMRRIEMLRDAKQGPANQRGRWPQWVAVTVLIVGAIGVSALRGAGAADPSKLVSQAAPDNPETKEPLAADLTQPPGAATQDDTAPGKINLQHIPNDAIFFVAVRPSGLIAQREMAPMLNELDKAVSHLGEAGITLDKIAQATVILEGTEHGLSELVLIEGTEPLDLARLAAIAKALLSGQDVPEYKGQREGSAFAKLGDSAVVVGRAIQLSAYLKQKHGEPAVASGEAWRLVHQNPVVTAVDMRLVRTLGGNQWRLLQQRVNEVAGNSSAVWDETEVIVAGVGLANRLRVTVATDCLGTRGASSVKDCFDLGSNSLRTLLRQARLATNVPAEASAVSRTEPEAIRAMWDAVDKGLSNVSVQQSGNLVTALAELELKVRGNSTLDALVPILNHSYRAAGRTNSASNARQIGQALLNYHDTYNHLPAAAGYGSDGKAKYPCSWRVLILPFINEVRMYNDYRFDEPWDSAHNRQFLTRMPAVYRGTGDDPTSTSSAFYVLIGKPKAVERGDRTINPLLTPPEPNGPQPVTVDVNLPTLFSKKNGRAAISYSEVVDGLSYTISIVEAKRDIPWTKPEDITFDPAGNLPKLGGYYADGFHVGFADGVVRFLPQDIPADKLKAYLTPSRGEQVAAP